LTVSGDLDGAIAIRDKIKSLEPEKPQTKEPEKPQTKANYFNDRIKSLENKTIKMSWTNGTVVLLPNGTLSSTWGDGTWKKEATEDTYTVIFGSGRSWRHVVKLNKNMTFTSIREDNDKIIGIFMIE